MIGVPAGAGIWLAVVRTDMRKGFDGLAMQVQSAEADIHLNSEVVSL
jgi:hypothetical protein